MLFSIIYLLAIPLALAIPHSHGMTDNINMNLMKQHHRKPMMMPHGHNYRNLAWNATANSTTGTGSALIQNSCAFPLYLWSVGSSISEQNTVAPYHVHREPYRHDEKSGGVAIKITTSPNGIYTGKPQMIFAYNLNRNESRVWYDLSDVFGDPFEGSQVQVQPADPEIRWLDGVPPRGSQVRVVNAKEDLKLSFC